MGHTVRRPSLGTGLRLTVAGAALAVILLPAVATQPAQAASYKVLHTFTGSPDGAFPYAGLVQDAAGNFYGTTTEGGTGDCTGHGIVGCGTVFKLDSGGNETVLYSFTGQTDGAYPWSTLLVDTTGSLYGTALDGGDLACVPPLGCGVVFEVNASGMETVLYSFQGGPTDGANPQAGLIRDTAGNLYGTTYAGGLSFGTVFELDKTGKESVLHRFKGNQTGDGAHPDGGLIRDRAGNLYGTTADGGSTKRCQGRGGCGTVFELDRAGKETVLLKFDGPDGEAPEAGLVRDNEDNLYGTTPYESRDFGTVFRLDKARRETVVHKFEGGNADGKLPYAGLIRDQEGNVYGTTYEGGPSNMGVVFKLDKAGTETVLHSFAGGGDGAHPYAQLVRDAAGNLYGTTVAGGGMGCGGAGCGVVFKLTP